MYLYALNRPPQLVLHGALLRPTDKGHGLQTLNPKPKPEPFHLSCMQAYHDQLMGDMSYKMRRKV